MADHREAELNDTVRENEKRIKELEKQAKDHVNCPAKIKALEEEIKRLKSDNRSLNEEIERLKEQLSNQDQRIKAFELTENQMCIIQLCTCVQKNICKIVLESYFEEKWDHNVKEMDEHIENLIEDEDERLAAKDRWESLKTEINWKPYWIGALSKHRKERNEAAHPPLTKEMIKKAKEELIKQNEIRAVDELERMLKLTNDKLPQRHTLTEPWPIQEAEDPHLTVTSDEDWDKMIRNNANARIGIVELSKLKRGKHFSSSTPPPNHLVSKN